jgi:N-carbamoyl-L-amino-acid hydrolase
MSSLTLTIDSPRLVAELEQLATWTDGEPPAVTRVVFTDTDLKARRYIKRLCEEIGLAVGVDPIGNLFARWEGREAELPAIATGSHIDAIPHSGRYDGTVGVLGGIEAVRALKRAGHEPRRSIELIAFTSEEPTRFGLGCLGSRALAGVLSAEDMASLRDGEGETLDAVRQRAGFHGPLSSVRLASGHYAAFVELHIEQGPLLEREGIPIGVVTAIAAPAALRVSIDGEGGHAGAVLMNERHDALCAAAEIVLAVESAATSTGSHDTVATTGICRVEPGAINSIPSRVRLGVDARDIDLARRDHLVEAVREAVAKVACARGVRAHVELLNADPPAEAADSVVGAVERACAQLRLPSRRMVSRAYHDTLFMARICPVGMVFIPCRGGVSHRPDEYASPEAIATGTNVLARTLAELAE